MLSDAMQDAKFNLSFRILQYAIFFIVHYISAQLCFAEHLRFKYLCLLLQRTHLPVVAESQPLTEVLPLLLLIRF
jgi:hypothetical protein